MTHVQKSQVIETNVETSPGHRAVLARMVERRLAEEQAKLRRVSFPPAGEGAFFEFAPSDLREFEEKFGAGWYSEVEARLLASSPDTVIRCMEIGLKRQGVRGAPQPLQIDPDSLQFSLSDAGEPALDAVTRTVFGKSRADLVAEITGSIAEA